MRIPILDLREEIQAHRQEFLGAFESVLDSGQFILGPNVGALEKEFASYLGVKHAIACNSGTDALIIGLRALGVQPGDEVLTTPFSFFATAEAVSLIGAVPVFADIEPESFNLDPQQLEKYLTPKTKALIPVHLFGHSADMRPISDFAKRHGLKVLEDVAQATGAEYKGQKVGALGDLSAFSFFPTKNLGAFGDGGMMATDDDSAAELCRMLRMHGSRRRYYNEMIGYNSRLDEMQAAFLRVKLKYLDKANEDRRQAAARYREVLQDIPGVTVPSEASYTKHVYHQYTIRISEGRRDRVQEKLQAQGITTMLYYPVPLHRLPMYDVPSRSFEQAEKAAGEVMSLPLWPTIDPHTQLEIASAIRTALQ
ncbi:DegT/DnrJ/EryC1/StrS family aminotransferase [bacterium]|nr:DegT/DnrJ/EryC1/StrS family aminotransferase [bacterium]